MDDNKKNYVKPELLTHGNIKKITKKGGTYDDIVEPDSVG